MNRVAHNFACLTTPLAPLYRHAPLLTGKRDDKVASHQMCQQGPPAAWPWQHPQQDVQISHCSWTSALAWPPSALWIRPPLPWAPAWQAQLRRQPRLGDEAACHRSRSSCALQTAWAALLLSVRILSLEVLTSYHQPLRMHNKSIIHIGRQPTGSQMADVPAKLQNKGCT